MTQEQIDRIVASVPGGVGNIQDIYPLAPLQEGILFHHLLQQEGDTYLMRSVLGFDSRERLDRFVGALQVVIDRHDILRTAVCWEGLSRPVQVVYRKAALAVEEIVLGEAEEDRLGQLLARTDPRRVRLDLTRAPLLTAYITPDPQTQEWLFALLSHQLISDHLTLALILDEIQLLLKGKGEELPAPVPYRNFIAQLQAVPPAEHEEYFRRQLGDVDEPTAPFGLLEVRSSGGTMQEAQITLSDALAKRIRETARGEGVSPAVLFHVAWARVLAQCTGRDDVVLGTILSGRLQGSEGADKIMGMFINLLPIRIQLEGRTVQQAVRETYLGLGELLGHEQASLGLAQRCSEVAEPLPLFTTYLNYRHSKLASDDHDPASKRPSPFQGIRVLQTEERTNYPIDMSVDDFGHGFGFVVHCVAGIDPQRVGKYLETAIEGLITALETCPDKATLALEILPDVERDRVVMGFNATERDYPREKLVHEFFEDRVASDPAAKALVYEEEQLSYGELNRRANQVAHRLIGLGIKPDDRVAIYMERSLEMVVGMLGILKAGGAYVPLDPDYPPERLSYMLADSSPVACVTHRMVEADDGLPGWLTTPRLPCVRLSEGGTGLQGEVEHNPVPQFLGLNPGHLAYVIYTSGSTGAPKGVMVEHRNVGNLIEAYATSLNLTAADRVLQFASYGFDNSVEEIFPALSRGATIVMRPKKLISPDADFLEFLKAYQITITDLPTAFWHQWAQNSDDGQVAALDALRLVAAGGEKAETRHLDSWFDKFRGGRHQWLNTYGPTEATVTVCAFRVDDCSAVPLGETPIGRPMANTQIYILDGRLQPVPLGVSGELYIGGAQVARGYLNRPELTAERFIADPFRPQGGGRLYKTGDLGRWLPDGTIEYLGRNDSQVKMRGYRIELGEIEAKLAGCDGVREAVVVAREEVPGDKRLVAYVVGQDGAEVSPAALREQLWRVLPEYMVPSAFVGIVALPLTPNGKLDRKALPAPDESAVIRREREAPVGQVEETIARVWQELLGLERIGRHDQFFELGGHSLLVLPMIERLRQQGMRLEVRAVFTAPTVASLAIAVAETGASGATFTVPPNLITPETTVITPEMLPLLS